MLYELKELVVFLIIGYSIAYALHPLVSKVEEKKIPRSVAIFLVVGGILCIMAIIFATAVPTVLMEWERLTQNLSQYIEIGKTKLEPYIASIEEKLPPNWRSFSGMRAVVDQTPLLKESLNGEVITGILAGVGATLIKGYNLTLTLVNIVLLPFIAYYVLLDFKTLHEAPLTLFPVTKRKKVELLFREMNLYVSSFVRGQFIVCTILFLLYAIGLGVIGVELWLLLALISGFGNLIPYVGFLTGIILSTLMALVTFGDATHVFFVWGLYAGVQVLEGTFITPRVLGDSVGLSPLAIILALVIGGQLFGLLGIFLAVPGAAVVKVLMKHIREWVVHAG